MNVLINPTKLSGSVIIPASKSQSHRAIICASLAKGKSVINNIGFSDDIHSTIAAMEKIGAKIVRNEHQLIIQGVSRIMVMDDNFIDCNESGSTLRFLIPILSLSKQKIVLTGKPSLFKRPMSIYEQIFKDRHLTYQQNERSIIIDGSITPGLYKIPGNISSQFVSGLMFSLPLLKEDSIIEIDGELESKEYIDMTLDVLNRFGIKITIENGKYIIKGNQKYLPTKMIIEGDYSQMAFHAVAGLLGGDIICKNLSSNSLQPDRRILEFIKKMDGLYEPTSNGYIFHCSNTIGTTIDVSQSPDIAPILAVLGALSKGKTIIDNAARLKYKESNRLSSTYETLKQMNVKVEMTDAALLIEGQNYVDGGVFESFNDHRIVMAIAIAAIRATKPVLIRNADAINKSYPNFFQDYQRLGGNITIMEE
jgi:3-phosphoshikimate 1-carboxyvinyltransferase